MLNKIHKNIKIILYIIITSIILSSFYICYIEKKITPKIYKYINRESRRFTVKIINSSINDIISKTKTDDLFIVKRTTNNEIEIIDLNTKKLNKILKQININIQNKLISLENGIFEDKYKNKKYKKFNKIKQGVLYEIPISNVKNNIILSNIGPSIPLKLTFLGNVKTNTITNIKSYGINNLVIEIKIKAEINEQITMPLTSKEQKIVFEAPLVLKIIHGKIPKYYKNNIDESSITSTIFLD